MLRRTALALLALVMLAVVPAQAQSADRGCGMEPPYQTVMAAPSKTLVHMELAGNVTPCTTVTPTAVTPVQDAEWGCGGLPPYDLVIMSSTRFAMQLELAAKDKKCLGVAQRVKVGTATRYRVLWVPCPGQAGWRLGGDSTTMAKAFAAASRPPACLTPTAASRRRGG